MSGDYVELTYLKFGDVKDFLTPRLLAYGYGARSMPTFHPGPPDPNMMKTTPGPIVFLAVGGGPGLTKEGSFDGVFITTRTVGEQRDHDGAHRLAMAVDRAFLSFGDSDMLGSVYALGITRTGGPPSLLMQDTAERYHFPGSYVTETETGL